MATAQKSKFSDWALVALTGALVITSLLQWNAMRDSLRTTERAWLQLQAEPDLDPQSEKVPKVVHVWIRNVGRGVARNIVIHSNMLSMKMEDRGHPERPTPVPSLSMLSNVDELMEKAANPAHMTLLGGGTDIKVGLPIPSVDAEAMNEFREGKVTLFIYGRCAYEDQFRKKHTTKFCNYYSVEAQGWTHCSDYSEAD